jgi:hypothetical protein
VEKWEEEKMETTDLKKIIQYRIQWEMKKMDVQLLTPPKIDNPQKGNLG